MKTILNKLTPILVCVTAVMAYSQNVEVVHDEVRATAFQNKSYLVVKSLTIKPPSGGGSFTVNASTNGSFFIRLANPTTSALSV
ncbi:MAG: hypothetical protein RIA63_06245, partial [Cyclobacteriaceae bacterium]